MIKSRSQVEGGDLQSPEAESLFVGQSGEVLDAAGGPLVHFAVVVHDAADISAGVAPRVSANDAGLIVEVVVHVHVVADLVGDDFSGLEVIGKVLAKGDPESGVARWCANSSDVGNADGTGLAVAEGHHEVDVVTIGGVHSGLVDVSSGDEPTGYRLDVAVELEVDRSSQGGPSPDVLGVSDDPPDGVDGIGSELGPEVFIVANLDGRSVAPWVDGPLDIAGWKLGLGGDGKSSVSDRFHDSVSVFHLLGEHRLHGLDLAVDDLEHVVFQVLGLELDLRDSKYS